MHGLVFGWRTAVLSVVVVQALLVTGGLLRVPQNRAANRTMASLLVVLAGVLTPWMIGFAGVYDKWRQMTFAPFALTLAVAPLIWLYVHALTRGRWPANGWRHLLPAGAQAAVLTASFLLPQPLKLRWASIALEPLTTATSIGAVAGLAIYAVGALCLIRDYRRTLAQQRSDDARFAVAWLSRALAATLVLLHIWACYAVWDAIAPLGYVRLMGLYTAIAAFTLYLSLEGWRHATVAFPTVVERPASTPARVAPRRDWRAQGEAWAAEVRAADWVREPELSLAGLAQRLGTNTGYLSRALNEGLGVSFSDFVNGLRSEAVAAALSRGERGDLLQIAFDAGFASKASFNRAFRARYGESPSAYRRRGSHPEKAQPPSGSEAQVEQMSAIRGA